MNITRCHDVGGKCVFVRGQIIKMCWNCCDRNIVKGRIYVVMKEFENKIKSFLRKK